MKLDETSTTEFYAQYGTDSLMVRHNGKTYDLKTWLRNAKFDTTISKVLLAIKKKMNDLICRGQLGHNKTIEDFIKYNFSLDTPTPDVFIHDGTSSYGGDGKSYATFDDKELGKTLMEKKMKKSLNESGSNTYEPLSTIQFWPVGAGLYEVYINGVETGLFDEDDYEKLHSLEARFLEGLKKLLEPTMKTSASSSMKNINEAKVRKDDFDVTVITYGGKINKYTEDEIKDIIDNFDEYECADNIPKWIYVSAFIINSPEIRSALRPYKGSHNDKIKQLLIAILKNRKAILNLRSDNLYENYISFESYEEKCNKGLKTKQYIAAKDIIASILENYDNYKVKSTDEKYFLETAKIILANLEYIELDNSGRTASEIFEEKFKGKDISGFIDFCDDKIDFSNPASYNDSLEEMLDSLFYEDEEDDNDDD